MQAHYPEGSYTFGHEPEGGLSFYAKGPSNFDLANAKEVTFSYSVLFEDSFEFNKGGKLPGVCECLVSRHCCSPEFSYLHWDGGRTGVSSAVAIVPGGASNLSRRLAVRLPA